MLFQLYSSSPNTKTQAILLQGKVLMDGMFKDGNYKKHMSQVSLWENSIFSQVLL
jgi:hypothetical protein